MIQAKKVGETIVCVNTEPLKGNDKAPELELNKEYKVKEIFICKCKEEHLNVGLELTLNYVECFKCRETLPDTNHWCHTSRFVNKNTLTF